ncbi:CAP domain-containing protein [Paenibacillus dokdonensis]|uniref:CAP domain-containing protein n=1 Tax=Paenibacillus dokdonensis TaxID=2567944 RepID=A0ABU6GS83_9BACL|nr:CAP domain-containing protein [Paenibacillus dokdonensis]MEC0242611.1 CAP domain-containing protein [Paenibacillus dokdonensis]
MVKYIVLAVCILATGCSANHTSEKQVSQKQATHKQMIPNQTRITNQTRLTTHAHRVSPNAVMTQASSTATSRIGKSSITTKDNGIPSELLDLIQSPAGNKSAHQTPTGNPMNQAPTGTVGKTPTGTGTSTGTPTGTGSGSAGQTQEGNTGGNTGGNTESTTKDSSQFAQQVLDLVNKERSKAGLSSLSMDGELSKMAMAKAQDMYDNNYFDHNSPTHGSPFDMMKEFGITYKTAGENIAKGQTTPTQVMNDWMNSPGHKANILNNGYSHIGIAFYNNEWVQEFTG